MVSDWIAPYFNGDPIPVLVLLVGVTSVDVSQWLYLDGSSLAGCIPDQLHQRAKAAGNTASDDKYTDRPNTQAT